MLKLYKCEFLGAFQIKSIYKYIQAIKDFQAPIIQYEHQWIPPIQILHL